MCVLDGWLSSKGRDSFGMNLGRPIVTSGDFVALLRSSARAMHPSQITLGGLVLYQLSSFCVYLLCCVSSTSQEICWEERIQNAYVECARKTLTHNSCCSRWTCVSWIISSEHWLLVELIIATQLQYLIGRH